MSVIGISAPRAPRSKPSTNPNVSLREVVGVIEMLREGNSAKWNWNQHFQKAIEAIQMCVIRHIADDIHTTDKRVIEALKAVKAQVSGKTATPSRFGIKACGFYSETIFDADERKTMLSSDADWLLKLFRELSVRACGDMDLSDMIFQGTPGKPVCSINVVTLKDNRLVPLNIDLSKIDKRLTPKNLVRIGFGADAIDDDAYMTAQEWRKEHPVEKHRREKTESIVEEERQEIPQDDSDRDEANRDDVYDHIGEDFDSTAEAEIQAKAKAVAEDN